MVSVKTDNTSSHVFDVQKEKKNVKKKRLNAFLINFHSCLTVSPEERPDILQLGGHLSDLLLRHMDVLRISEMALEKKLDKERKRTQK